MIYRDRRHAGASLAERLLELSTENPLVLALPGGGVPVAYEIAKELLAPLDLLLVRELGAGGAAAPPGVVFGAITQDTVELDTGAVIRLRLSESEIETVVAREQKELQRSVCHFQIVRRPALVEGRTVILVDDGLSNGLTARAAIATLRKRNPRKIIFAAPVCAPAAAAAVTHLVEALVCGAMPEHFDTTAAWYRDYAPIPDEEVVRFLRQAAAEHEHPGGDAAAPAPSFWEERR